MGSCWSETGDRSPAILPETRELGGADGSVVECRVSSLLAKLKAAFAARAFGNRSRDASHMGPLANEASRQRIHAMVERARAEGAIVEAGGFLPEGEGYFYPPTLLSGCRRDMEIVREEVFGPVLAVLRYSDFEQALALASDHQFGLSSVLFTCLLYTS
ncbi:aldehyde dehydrogenase family protein, partial [Ensifer sp. LC54]|uniref:aldehyde dehydrogenase family protein n=1 Tax=Ensifer sp. LC54 TaxID=1873715 RepID=UPI001FCD2DE6